MERKEKQVSLHDMPYVDWLELQDQVNCFSHITDRVKEKVKKIIQEHQEEGTWFMTSKDQQADTICHTLMKVYVFTEDLELKERVLEALIMGRRMYDSMKEKNKEITKFREEEI